jgi:hypothetical protein
MLRERPALGTCLRVLAGTPQFKPRLKAEILADAKKFYGDYPVTIWILECEIGGLTAKTLLEMLRECSPKLVVLYSALSPAEALKGFIDDVVVPALVNKFLAEKRLVLDSASDHTKRLADDSAVVHTVGERP